MIIRFVLTTLGVAALMAIILLLRNPAGDWMHTPPKSWLSGGAVLLATGAAVSLVSIVCERLSNRGGVIGKEIGRKSWSFWDNFIP